MELTLRRIARRDTYTIGKLYVDGVYECDTIEDKDRGLTSEMSQAEILRKKVYGETAIPAGRYRVRMDQPSPKYQQKAKQEAYYKQFCDHMPRLENVKGYSGVLIHPGSTEKDTMGCLLVGENKVVGRVINSRHSFKVLYDKLMKAEGEIWITVK